MEELNEECLVVHDIEGSTDTVSPGWELSHVDTWASVASVTEDLAAIVVSHQRVVSLHGSVWTCMCVSGGGGDNRTIMV